MWATVGNLGITVLNEVLANGIIVTKTVGYYIENIICFPKLTNWLYNLTWYTDKVRGRVRYMLKVTADKTKRILIAIFVMYIFVLFVLLFLPNVFRNIGAMEKMPLFSSEHFEGYSNLIPFKTIYSFIERFMNNKINTSVVLVNLVGNLIAFAPFGFFIPVLFKNRIKNIWSFIIFMIVLVFVVEFTQFIFCIGMGDVDDIILNVLGAVIVYALIKTKPIKKLFDILKIEGEDE